MRVWDDLLESIMREAVRAGNGLGRVRRAVELVGGGRLRERVSVLERLLVSHRHVLDFEMDETYRSLWFGQDEEDAFELMARANEEDAFW